MFAQTGSILAFSAQSEMHVGNAASVLQMSGALSPSDRDGEGPKIFEKFWKPPPRV
jgi:hypothetical protein